MAQGKKSFILYSDQRSIIDMLTNEQAGILIKHIYSYVNDENPTLEDLSLKLAFEPIKLQLKRDLKKWEKQHNQRVLAGKKSAEVRKRNATSVNERSISSTVNVNVNVIDIINNIYNDFVDEVKKGEHAQAIEQMYISLKIQKGSLTQLLTEFKAQLIISETTHKDTLEFRKHFFNWLNTQDRVGKLQQYKKQKTI